MSSAVQLMCDYCFNVLSVRKIEGYVYGGNIASQKVLENNKFVKEGLRRKKHMLRDGEILDDICYGLLKEEYIK
jgi:RimJ/RimL family protein N-acetyltransferase